MKTKDQIKQEIKQLVSEIEQLEIEALDQEDDEQRFVIHELIKVKIQQYLLLKVKNKIKR